MAQPRLRLTPDMSFNTATVIIVAGYLGFFLFLASRS